MKNILYGYTKKHIKHFDKNKSLETPERVEKNHQNIIKNFKNLSFLKERKSTIKEIELFHNKKYIKSIKNIENSTYIDNYEIDKEKVEETYVNSDTFEVCQYSIGQALNMIDLIKTENYNYGFLNIRPRGKHATTNTGKKYCIFNNIGIMRQYAKKIGFKEILIIDFDLFHGDGIQEKFYKENDIIYFSTHKSPGFPPNTGFMNQLGEDKGLGFNHNYPIDTSFSGEKYVNVYKNDLNRTLKYINPELIIVSSGFNILKGDYETKSKVKQEEFEKIINSILSLNKKTIFSLEGGMKIDNIIKGSEIILNKINMLLKPTL